MAFARSDAQKAMRLGALTPYWELAADPEKVRQVYPANLERQMPYIVAISDEALASATRFKDFAGRGVPAFAATLAFVDVHLINVSGSEGESKKPKNFFIECKHVQVM